MCNPKPSSSSPFLCPDPKLKNHRQLQDDDELHRCPTPNEVTRETERQDICLM